MKTSTSRALENSMRSVEETHAVHTALLVNPSEVYELTYSYQKELRTTLRGCWTLDGIVSDTRFEELRANIGKKVMHEITATTTLAGAAYAVISSQLGNWQHRFLLPLYESKAIEMFAGASKEPLSLHFSSAGEDQGSIFYRRVFSADDYMLVSSV